MRPLLLALTSLLLLAAPAAAATGKFFAGEPVDAATADVVALQDVDVSRDGTGAVVYLRRDGGEVHVFVSRLVGGALQPPERVDGGLPGAATQASVAAGDGGRLAVAFVTGGAVHTVVRPAGQAWLPAQRLADVGSDPSAGMSAGGHAYVVFRTGGDLRAVRMDRRETAFAPVPSALDVDPTQDAGANGAPRVAVSADGTAIAVWGEGGRVVARRLFGLNVSRAPQELAAQGDSPDVGIEDDSSYAWAVYRTPDGAFGRRQRGSSFDEPTRVDRAGDVGQAPRIAVSGRGEGYVGVTGAATGQVLGTVLKDDKLFAPVAIGQGFGGRGVPAPAVAESGDGAIAYIASDGTVKARSYDNNPRSRVATAPNPEVTLSDPGLGTADPALGLDADANRAGDVLVAWIQVDALGGRRLVAGAFDRLPGAFTTTTTTKWRGTPRPQLRWSSSFELWGELTYRVEVGGQPVGESTTTSLLPLIDLPDGLHSWVVVARDRRGQEQRTRPRNLRIDGTPPALELRVRRRMGVATITAEATDDPGTGARASGLRFVRFTVGSRVVTLTKPPFRVRRRARGSIRVSATDMAGNAVAVTRSIARSSGPGDAE